MSKRFSITKQEINELLDDVSRLLYLNESVLNKHSYIKIYCNGGDILKDDKSLLKSVYELIISSEIEDSINPNVMDYLHSMFFSSSKKVREGFFNSYLTKTC